jgi:hypothetical protein
MCVKYSIRTGTYRDSTYVASTISSCRYPCGSTRPWFVLALLHLGFGSKVVASEVVRSMDNVNGNVQRDVCVLEHQS